MLKIPGKYTLTIIVFSLLVSGHIPITMAWENDTTHVDISGVAAERSILGTGYLQRSLGMRDGLNTTLQWLNGTNGTDKFVRAWIQDGANFEDSGGVINGRFYNHFHNPLLPWANAGLNDSGYLFGFIYWTKQGESALLWAQNKGVSDQTNTDWSWELTRSHYYQALKTNQDAEWAQTFVGLGHQIHLLQDMSQPSHVRNDGHPEDFVASHLPGHWPERMEHWASINNLLARGFMNAASVFPTMNLNTSVPGFVPITALWDTDNYVGTAATLPAIDSANVGLAEYTNANFFSDDTINSFKTRHHFPFPSVNMQDYVVCSDQAPPGSYAIRRWYISRLSKTPNGVCPQQGPDHFLAGSLLQLIQNSISQSAQMDSRVYEDYAKALLPRAVGYSAALINYFFRGGLDVHPVAGGIRVQNVGTEIMDSYFDSTLGSYVGKIEVYYDNGSQRLFLKSQNLQTPLPPGGTLDLLFSPPMDNIQPGRYVVIFLGKLGAENGAVAGGVIPEYIYYVGTDVNGLKQIFRINSGGGDVTLVYDNLAAPLDIGRLSLSPDGKKLAFGAGSPPQTAKIYLFDLASPHQTIATLLTAGDAPAWSPDGTKIAFERESGLYLPSAADVEIFTIDPLSNIETQLTNIPNSSYSGNPAWSPDGSKIAYSRDNSNPQEPDCANFYVITLMTSLGQPLGPVSCYSDSSYSDAAPAWSPDGQALVFTRKRPSQNGEQLFRANLMTTPPTITKLTDSNGIGFRELWPVWSPDGTRIAVGSSRDGDADIWLIDPNRDPNNSYLTNLTNENLGSDQFPTFGR